MFATGDPRIVESGADNTLDQNGDTQVRNKGKYRGKYALDRQVDMGAEKSDA